MIFRGVLSRALVLPSRPEKGEGKALKEDEQLICAGHYPRALDSWICACFIRNSCVLKHLGSCRWSDR